MSTSRARNTMLLILAVMVMLAAFAAFFWVFQLPAGAAASPPPRHWLITQPELARVQAAGGTASFEWVMCDPVRGSDTSCPVPTFTSYYDFARWARSGGTGAAEIDYESSVTPRWQMTHLLRYVRL